MSYKAKIETRDVEPPKATTVEIASTVDVVERPDLVVADVGFDSEYLKDLKFNEDILTISIGESTDPNAENPVPCGCNGEIKWLQRGQEYKMARKFVDSLIKREDKVKTVNYKDEDNVDQTRIEKKPAMKYPLAVLNDPAGELGTRWFKFQQKNAW